MNTRHISCIFCTYLNLIYLLRFYRNTVPKYSSNISNFDYTYIEEICFSVNFDSFYNESVYGKSCRISNEADHDIKRASRSSGLTSGFLSSVT